MVTPRNNESSEYEKFAKSLLGQTRAVYLSNKFEFHHWDYKNHDGVILCPKCHEYIHDGVRARDQHGGPEGDWKITAYNNLVNLYERHNGRIEDWQKFWKRLNIEKYDFAVVSE